MPEEKQEPLMVRIIREQGIEAVLRASKGSATERFAREAMQSYLAKHQTS